MCVHAGKCVKVYAWQAGCLGLGFLCAALVIMTATLGCVCMRHAPSHPVTQSVVI